MRSMEKKIYLGLLVCLLVSMVGVSFAYFTMSTTIGGTGGATKGSTADLISVKYDAGSSTLELTNAVPGLGKEKSFSVIVTPTNNEKSVTYAIMLNISSNNFVKCSDSNYNATTNACTKNAEELVYTLMDKNGTTIATGDLLGKTGKITLAKQTKSNITAATTYEYKLNITFKNTNADQNHNINKTFAGNINVEFADAD